MLYFRAVFKADLAPSQLKYVNMQSEGRVNLVWHKFSKSWAKELFKDLLAKQITGHVLFKALALPAENIANKHTFN